MDCNMECMECLKELCLHKVPLFSSLSRDEFEKLAEQMTFRRYKAGEMILAQGEIPQAITIIRKGSAKAFKITPEGQEKILYVFSRNDYFGEQYLFGEQKAAYSVAALQSVKTCSFTREHFRELVRTHPTLAVEFMEELGNRVIRLEAALHSAGNDKIETRIAAVLLDFQSRYGTQTPRGKEIILPLSREGMANYLGIARETLSRRLSQMEEAGIFESHGNKKLLVLRPEELEKLAQSEE